MPLLVVLGLAGALLQSPVAIETSVVSGRVLEQDTHAPLAGVQVMLIKRFEGRPPSPPWRAGRCRPPPTEMDDSCSRTSNRAATSSRPRNPGSRRQSAAGASRSLELKGGERRENLEFTLLRGGVIAGRVVDQQGEPLVGVQVSVLRKPPVAQLPSGRSAGPTTAAFASRLMPAGPGAQTNDLGEFRLHSLSPGEYYVQAMTRPDFSGGPLGAVSASTASTMMVPTFFPGTTDSAAAQPIVVGAGQTSGDVEVRMIVAAASLVSGVRGG